jgi:thioredoxin-related protein
VEKLNQQYNNNDLKILLINLKEEKKLVTSFIRDKNYSSSVLLDTEGEVAKIYSVYGIPVSYLVDKQGKIALQLTGEVDWSSAKMNLIIDNLINE